MNQTRHPYLSRREWIAVAGSAVISVLSHPAAAAPCDHHRHRSDASGFFANAYLIEGPQSCVLIDAHLNLNEARDLAALAARTGKPVTAIVITHPHPDHYLGLEVLGPLFPDAVIASSETTLRFIRTAATDWPGFANPFRPLATGTVTLAETRFDCIVMPDAESAAPIILFDPVRRTLVAGDHVLNRQHLWLVEGRADAWRQNLEYLKKLSPTQVLPGHGAVGGAELLRSTDAYLRDFMHLSEKYPSISCFTSAMLDAYPDHVFPTALDRSALVLN